MYYFGCLIHEQKHYLVQFLLLLSCGNISFKKMKIKRHYWSTYKCCYVQYFLIWVDEVHDTSTSWHSFNSTVTTSTWQAVCTVQHRLDVGCLYLSLGSTSVGLPVLCILHKMYALWCFHYYLFQLDQVFNVPLKTADSDKDAASVVSIKSMQRFNWSCCICVVNTMSCSSYYAVKIPEFSLLVGFSQLLAKKLQLWLQFWLF